MQCSEVMGDNTSLFLNKDSEQSYISNRLQQYVRHMAQTKKKEQTSE